jgi:hypothetical protein
VFQAYVLPEHYFLQIDPEAQGGWAGGGGVLAGRRAPADRNCHCLSMSPSLVQRCIC